MKNIQEVRFLFKTRYIKDNKVASGIFEVVATSVTPFPWATRNNLHFQNGDTVFIEKCRLTTDRIYPPCIANTAHTQVTLEASQRNFVFYDGEYNYIKLFFVCRIGKSDGVGSDLQGVTAFFDRFYPSSDFWRPDKH